MKDAYFRANFTYDPVEGIVRRLNGALGTKTAKGYRYFGGKQDHACMAHRIAWFLHHGHWPSKGIDHINGHKDDNRICNLRLASQHDNMGNVGKYSNNTSGYKGVHYRKDRGKWQAGIQMGPKFQSLGMFKSPEEAHAAYCAAAAVVFGEFARAA